VTPFDPSACLAMLLAFYPVVTPAALALARSERPEYFAAGLIFGSKGDKLQLPDGRVFDVIQNAGGLPGTQRWQMIEPGPGGGDEVFPLEPGPLTPIDPGPDVVVGNAGTFEALVGGALESLVGAEGVLDSAAHRVTEGIAAGALIDGASTELDDVEQVAWEIGVARSAEELADVIGQVDELGGAIDATDADYDEPPPQPALPSEPGIPAYPGDDGTDGEPGRENPRHPEHPGPSHGDD